MKLLKKRRNPPEPQKGYSARICQTLIALMLTLFLSHVPMYQIIQMCQMTHGTQTQSHT